MEQHPQQPVRVELGLWYRDNPELRSQARVYLEELLRAIDGRLLDFVTIEPIHYQAALVEIPTQQARALRDFGGPIADADRIMRIRPQSMYNAEARDPLNLQLRLQRPPSQQDSRPPIAALIDGYPIQNHSLLANRVDVEEVDITGTNVPVARRFHGTAMSSLILHGDIAANDPPLTRTLKVIPILAAPQGLNHECTPPDKLPLALVFRAVTAFHEGIDGSPPLGERVVLFNHSICDEEAPFARRPSAWAKLLDYLAVESQQVVLG